MVPSAPEARISKPIFSQSGSIYERGKIISKLVFLLPDAKKEIVSCIA
jgi:hypothetical protein